MADACLLAIDLQNDFVSMESPTGVNGGSACIPRCIAAVDIARAQGIPVVWVWREHLASGIDVELFRVPLFMDGPGSTVAGSWGASRPSYPS
jgi:nicotinamidase-related amidase